jgi:hypothetical protein
VANSEGQGRHCTTLIFLTLDFEEKPSLREFLTGSLGIVVYLCNLRPVLLQQVCVRFSGTLRILAKGCALWTPISIYAFVIDMLKA